jgi:hypothetical protein
MWYYTFFSQASQRGLIVPVQIKALIKLISDSSPTEEIIVLKEKELTSFGYRFYFYLPDKLIPLLNSFFSDIKLIPDIEPQIEGTEIIFDNTSLMVKKIN